MRTITRVSIFLLACLLFVGNLPAYAQSSNAQRNKKAYADALAQASKGMPDALYQLYSDHYKMMGQDVSRKDTQEATGNALIAAIPDLQLIPDVILAQNDLVAAAVIYSGTFTKPFNLAAMGPNPFPPTNKPVTWMEIDILRFNADGKIVEQWVGSRPDIMLTELGIILPQSANPNAPPVKYLTDPLGSKALKPNELAATFTSGMEKRNRTFFSKSEARPVGSSLSDLTTDPYISRGNAFGPEATTPGDDAFAVGILRKAMPDMKMKFDPVLAEGDWAAGVATLTGTFTGEVQMGPSTLKPTGKVIIWSAVQILLFNADGKVTELWSIGDGCLLVKALGMVPSACATPAK